MPYDQNIYDAIDIANRDIEPLLVEAFDKTKKQYKIALQFSRKTYFNGSSSRSIEDHVKLLKKVHRIVIGIRDSYLDVVNGKETRVLKSMNKYIDKLDTEILDCLRRSKINPDGKQFTVYVWLSSYDCYTYKVKNLNITGLTNKCTEWMKDFNFKVIRSYGYRGSFKTDTVVYIKMVPEGKLNSISNKLKDTLRNNLNSYFDVNN